MMVMRMMNKVGVERWARERGGGVVPRMTTTLTRISMMMMMMMIMMMMMVMRVKLGERGRGTWNRKGRREEGWRREEGMRGPALPLGLVEFAAPAAVSLKGVSCSFVQGRVFSF